MSVMDYVYRQRISLKKKEDEIKDVLTITSKWIWEVEEFVRVCVSNVFNEEGRNFSKHTSQAASIFSLEY